MSNVRAFVIGLLFIGAGTTLLGFMMANNAWMTMSSGAETSTEDGIVHNDHGKTIEYGLYGAFAERSSETCLESGDGEPECEKTEISFNLDYSDMEEKKDGKTVCEHAEEQDDQGQIQECEVKEAGDLGHWILVGGMIVGGIGLILALIGIPGYMPGFLPALLVVLFALAIVVGSVVWLVMFPDSINDDIEDSEDRFSPSYAFYLSLLSAPLIFLGGVAWGGIEAFALGNDDYDEDEEEWIGIMDSADVEDSNWRRQSVPTMIPQTEAYHLYQHEQALQQYEYRDQSYHHEQSYAQPRQQWSNPAQAGPPRSAPPMSGPPKSGPPMSGPPKSGPPMSGQPHTAPPVSGPPRSQPTPAGPPQSSPAPAGSPQSSPAPAGPPRSSPAPAGPPRSQPSPRVRKAVVPSQPVPSQPSPVQPVQQTPAQPVPPVQPVAAPQPTPVVPAQPSASPQTVVDVTQYVQPVMPAAPSPQSEIPPITMSGTLRPDGWEILEWPAGSGKWFWKDRNSGRWTRWT